jgi:ribosomal protein S18 acetylase RimI-like enzyme
MIRKFKKVDAVLRKEIDGLIDACEKADGLRTDIFTDEYLNFYKDMHCAFAYYEENAMKAFLFVFSPQIDEVELTVLVSPGSRGKGVFKALVGEAAAESVGFGYHRGLLVCNAASKTGMQAMAHYGYPIHHTEYEMRCAPIIPKDVPEGFRLVRARHEDIPELAKLGTKIFGRGEDEEASIMKSGIESSDRTQWKFELSGKAIGICATRREDKKIMIYGLGIHPDERRKGYARILLDLVAKEALASGAEELFLEVDSENPPALRLYRSYGFADGNVVHYYEFGF